MNDDAVQVIAEAMSGVADYDTTFTMFAQAALNGLAAAGIHLHYTDGVGVPQSHDMACDVVSLCDYLANLHWRGEAPTQEALDRYTVAYERASEAAWAAPTLGGWT